MRHAPGPPVPRCARQAAGRVQHSLAPGLPAPWQALPWQSPRWQQRQRSDEPSAQLSAELDRLEPWHDEMYEAQRNDVNQAAKNEDVAIRHRIVLKQEADDPLKDHAANGTGESAET